MAFLSCLPMSLFAQEYNQEELDCLAQNIYFEARNQETIGMVAVGEVTLNRVASSKYPNTICEVVWEPKQFSWTHDGKSDKMKNKKARQKAYLIAYAVLHIDYNLTNGATHYHAIYVDPFWADENYRITQVEDHVFYRYD